MSELVRILDTLRGFALLNQAPEVATMFSLALELARGADRDAARLDWLSNEMNREQDALNQGRLIPKSLFRANRPIKRDDIDAAQQEYGSIVWRIGAKVPLNIYAGDRPVCQCHNAQDAALIVAAVNRRQRSEQLATENAALAQRVEELEDQQEDAIEMAKERFTEEDHKCSHYGQNTYLTVAFNNLEDQLAALTAQRDGLREALVKAQRQLSIGRRFLPSHGSFGEEGIDAYEHAQRVTDVALRSTESAPATTDGAAVDVTCDHERLDEDGMCRSCGKDCRRG